MVAEGHSKPCHDVSNVLSPMCFLIVVVRLDAVAEEERSIVSEPAHLLPLGSALGVGRGIDRRLGAKHYLRARRHELTIGARHQGAPLTCLRRVPTNSPLR